MQAMGGEYIAPLENLLKGKNVPAQRRVSCPTRAPVPTVSRIVNIHTRPIQHPTLIRIRKLLASIRPVDPTALHNAYLQLKLNTRFLTRFELSNLIAFFGAISACGDVSHLPRRLLSDSQFALLGRLPTKAYDRTWWDLCLELEGDQSALERRIPDEDRYWLMLAHLGWVSSGMQKQTIHSGSTKRVLKPEAHFVSHLVSAHGHYAVVAENHLDEAVHVSYLHALLDIHKLDSQSSLPIAQANLADALVRLIDDTRFQFEPRLVRLVWYQIFPFVHFTLSERQSILGALGRRAAKHVSRTRSLNHPDSDSDEDKDPIHILRHAILDISSSDEAWVRVEAQAIVHDGWASLFWTPSALAPCPPLPPRRLNILLGLRYLAKSQVRDLLERLWNAWMTVLGSEVGRAEELQTAGVDRAILLRFLKFATSQKSDRVLSGAERLLRVQSSVVLDQDRIRGAESIKNPDESMSVLLGAAWVYTGTTNLAVLAARMQGVGFEVIHGQFPDTYLAKVVQVLLGLDAPSIAWLVAQQRTTQLPVDLVVKLSSACALAGNVSQAASFLADDRLSNDSKFSIALLCLPHCTRGRVVLARRDAIEMCEAIGPRMDDMPRNLRHTAVWMALNVGLVRLAGLMGVQWTLSRRMQRKLATRLAKARVTDLALRVVRMTMGTPERDVTRLRNIQISRAGRRRTGQARVRETLTLLAHLLRTAHRRPAHLDKRSLFRPDLVTLNIVCRVLTRAGSGLSLDRLKNLFDCLAMAGMCGPIKNYFGTHEPSKHERAIIALAAVVRSSDVRLSYVRHTRPLIKSFLIGFQLRGDKEAARTVVGVLEVNDAAWRSGGAVSKL